MLDADLKSKIKKLWDKFWSGGISNPLQAIEQMLYLIFMKNLEDEDVMNLQNSRFTGESYESIFHGNGEEWKTLREYLHMPGFRQSRRGFALNAMEMKQLLMRK